MWSEYRMAGRSNLLISVNVVADPTDLTRTTEPGKGQVLLSCGHWTFSLLRLAGR
jgi:hypothetical protein